MFFKLTFIKRFNEFHSFWHYCHVVNLPFGVYNTILRIVILKEAVLFLTELLDDICKYYILNVDTLKNKNTEYSFMNNFVAGFFTVFWTKRLMINIFKTMVCILILKREKDVNGINW